MPTILDIILYNELGNNTSNSRNIKNKNKSAFEKNKNKSAFEENKNIFEENKKNILDSFVNYPRLELIKRYKIQTYQFLMNKNYRNIFIKLLIIPISINLCYNSYSLKKYKN